jgi:hypothetical protein
MRAWLATVCKAALWRPDTTRHHDQNMTEQGAWPTRYLVTIKPVSGEPRDFSVLTWLGRDKAIVMATHADGRGYGTPNGIYHVAVQELGPAARDGRGLVAVGDDLHDRMEF